jgi:hypothetical protein
MLNDCPSCGRGYPDFFPVEEYGNMYCGHCDDYFFDDFRYWETIEGIVEDDDFMYFDESDFQ